MGVFMERKIGSADSVQSRFAQESEAEVPARPQSAPVDTFEAGTSPKGQILRRMGQGFYGASRLSVDRPAAASDAIDPHAAGELIQKERDFLETVRKFKRLYSDPTLMSNLNDADKTAVLSHRTAIDHTLSSVGKFVASLHAATSTEAGKDPTSQLLEQGSAQREHSIARLLEAFSGPEFQQLKEALPDLVAAHATWESLAKSNQDKIRARSRDLNGEEDRTLDGYAFNPATPAMQRSFRYALTLNELAKSLPQGLRPQADLALEQAKQLATAADQTQPQDSPGKSKGQVSPPGSRLKRLLSGNA